MTQPGISQPPRVAEVGDTGKKSQKVRSEQSGFVQEAAAEEFGLGTVRAIGEPGKGGT